MLQKGPALALGGAHPLTTGPLPGEDDAGDHHHNQQQQPRQQRQQPQGPQRRQGSTSWTEPPSEDPPSRAPTTEGGTNTASGGAGAAEGASSSSSPCPSLASPREVARRRCFDVTEIIHLLTPGITPLPLSSRPPGGGMIGRGAGPGPGPGRDDGDDSPPPPPSGTLLLYDRVATRDYKRDGHSWVTKRVSSRKRGNKVAESSVKLRLDGRFRVAGWYARSDGSGVAPPTMRRRAYYLIDPDTMRPLGDWVLVHYLDDDVAARAAASASSASTSASMSMSRRARRGGVPGDGEIPQRRRSDEEQVGNGDARRSSAMSPPELLSDDDDAVHHAAGPPSAKVKKVSHDGDGGGGAASNKAPAPSHGDDAEPFSISGALSSFCDLNIAPRLTDEDVAKEWRSSFTEVERRRAMTDVYGSAVAGDHDDDGDCIENGQRQREQQQHQPADPTTPRSVTPCGSGPMLLESMDYELEMIPRHIKSDYLEARIRCPNLCSSDEVKSSFLRCEANCPKAAAHRMVQYWKKRVEIFGTDRAFLPLTLSGAMAGDSRELSAYARLLPGTDASGRAIIFFDNTATCSFMTRLRSSFYMAHAALENDGALRNGVVIVVFGPPPLAHVDRGLMLERQALFRDVLPVKVRAAHKCLFRRRDDGDRNIPRAYEVLNFTAGREWRARLVAHDGSREQLVLQLGEYGISISQLPSKIGGLVGDDYFAHWFELRRKMGL